MDFITNNNLNSLSFCDLNTKFNNRCYMDWSNTNLISIVSLEGIYILEPHLERSHGPYKIELIRNPAYKFKHNISSKGDSDNDRFDDIIPTFNNRQYMEILLDSALSTHIVRSNNDQSRTRKFRLAKWSPVIDEYPKECLLAAITIDYQLIIYGRRKGIWLSLADLSHEYDTIWRELNPANLSNENQPIDYESTRNSLHALSFCNICWDDRAITKNNRKNPLLLATTIHGDIVIWQLCYLRNLTNPTVFSASELKPEIKMILKTRQYNISCMKLHNGLLVASSRNGQVALYDLNIHLENIDSGTSLIPSTTNPSGRKQATTKQSKQKVATNHTVQVAVFEQPPTAVLWHQDNIEVTDFYLQVMDRETSRIVLAKSTNICWCMIQYIERTAISPATLIISDSFSAIDGLDPEISLHQTPATCLRPANNKRAVLIADDGSFFLLDFFDDRQDVSPSFNNIHTGKLDLTDMIPRGVSTSPNGHLISMISSVTFIFDPTRLPAPSKLITIPAQHDKEFLTSCLQNLLDEAWLQARGVGSPMDVCDFIDHVRSTLPTFTHKQCDKLLSLLKTNLQEMEEPETEVQLVKLKIIGFILLKLSAYCNAGSKLFDNTVSNYSLDYEKTICPMILYNEIEQILELLKDHDLKTTTYSLDQLNSLQNYLTWMNLDCENHEGSKFQSMKQRIRDKFQAQFEMIKNKDVTQMNQHITELCPICASEITFESVNFALCKNSHRFVRCSRSLLTIDARKDDAFECNHCKRYFVINRLWPTSNLWPCLYCQ